MNVEFQLLHLMDHSQLYFNNIWSIRCTNTHVGLKVWLKSVALAPVLKIQNFLWGTILLTHPVTRLPHKASSEQAALS